MKKLGVTPLLLLLLLNTGCGQSGSANKIIVDSVADIKFRNEVVEMGQIAANVSADCKFIFSNTGNIPLTITGVHATCHCTATTWPEKPINPGDSSIIIISFDPTGVTGGFIRTVQVSSNAKRSPIELTLKGEVLPDTTRKVKKPSTPQ